jgi:uncharacterized membrane protein HdeD (DUF308 family)
MSNTTIVVKRIPASLIWQVQILVGAITTVLGILLTFHPTGTLSFVMVVVGIGIVLGGALSLISALNPEDNHRAMHSVGGVVQVIVGVLLLRHLHWGLAVIGLLIGVSWIIQGLAALMAGIVGAARSRVWALLFGALSLIAGIVVVVAPIHSTKTLAILLGIWFLILGVIQVMSGFVLRSLAKDAAQA